MSDNSFPFPTYSGLLTPEHKKNIGPALWEFLWCISKTTKEKVSDGEKQGIVLGGKPIKHEDIADDLGVSAITVQRNMSRLKKHGYIETKRAPYGEIITVRNSKKFRYIKNDVSDGDASDVTEPDQSKMTDPDASKEIDQSDATPSDTSQMITPDTSQTTDLSDVTTPDTSHMSERSIKNDKCNKDIQDKQSNDRWIDNINLTPEQQDCDEIEKHYLNRKGNTRFNVSTAEYQMILDLVREGIPKADILAGIDSAFDYKGKGINSFAYCVKVIRRFYQQKKERSGIHAKNRHLHGRDQTKSQADSGRDPGGIEEYRGWWKPNKKPVWKA